MADRLSALEAVVIALLAEKFGMQGDGPRALAAFFDHARDVAGRSDAMSELEVLAERRRQFVATHGLR